MSRVEYMGERALPSLPQKHSKGSRKSNQHARTANFRSCGGGQVPHALPIQAKDVCLTLAVCRQTRSPFATSMVHLYFWFAGPRALRPSFQRYIAEDRATLG